MTEIVARQSAAAPIVFDAERKEVIRNTIAQGATDAELEMFIEICRATGFNPFLKEIWFIKSKGYSKRDGTTVEGRVQIMAAIDGFYRVANEHPEYDGLDREYGPDQVLTVQTKNGPVEIVAPEWVETKVYRKDRSRPQVTRAFWREYAQELVTFSQQLSIWAKMPRVMLEKCADATSLRKSFPQKLGGLYVPEEMPREYSADEDERRTVAEIEAEQRKNYLKQQAARLESGEYHIEHGEKRGTPISKATNSVWLEKHLAKYGDRLSEPAKEAISDRIATLKREYAKKLEAQQAAEVSQPAEQEGFDEGWTPGPDEIAEIEKAEQELAGGKR